MSYINTSIGMADQNSIQWVDKNGNGPDTPTWEERKNMRTGLHVNQNGTPANPGSRGQETRELIYAGKEKADLEKLVAQKRMEADGKTFSDAKSYADTWRAKMRQPLVMGGKGVGEIR